MIARIISWLTEARDGAGLPARSADVTAHDAFARAAEADRQMRLLQEIRVADRFSRDEAMHCAGWQWRSEAGMVSIR